MRRKKEPKYLSDLIPWWLRLWLRFGMEDLDSEPRRFWQRRCELCPAPASTIVVGLDDRMTVCSGDLDLAVRLIGEHGTVRRLRWLR